MPYSSGPGGVIPHLPPEVNFLMVEIPTLKPYIFMIRVTRQIKCLIAQALGVIPHPLPEMNFIMVEIPTSKPYIHLFFSFLLIYKTRPNDFDLQLDCCISDAFSIFFMYIIIYSFNIMKLTLPVMRTAFLSTLSVTGDSLI